MEKQEDRHAYLLGETGAAVYRYRLFNRVHEPATRDRLATLDIAPDSRVLEIGCGIGQTACLFATELVPDGHVIAFDKSPDLVKVARQDADERGITNVTFVCSSAQEFDFGSDRFDMAHSRFVLSYLPDAADTVARIFAAMRQGGLFFGEEIAQNYVLIGDTGQYEPVIGWFTRLIEESGGNPDYGLQQLPSEMFASGFRDLRATAYFPLEHQSTIAEMMSLALSGEMKPHLVALGIATEEQVDAVIGALKARERNFIASPAMIAQIIGRKP